MFSSARWDGMSEDDKKRCEALTAEIEGIQKKLEAVKVKYRYDCDVEDSWWVPLAKTP